jgi:hypothetical protein
MAFVRIAIFHPISVTLFDNLNTYTFGSTYYIVVNFNVQLVVKII